MNFPLPRKGQIINYSYLWQREADAGRVEGRKNRPSAVVLAQKSGRVAVVPITHSPPLPGTKAIEIPLQVKRLLGMDNDRSWIITSEVNGFIWPGYDLAPFEDGDISFGTLPPTLLKRVLMQVSWNAHEGRLSTVLRETDSDRPDP